MARKEAGQAVPGKRQLLRRMDRGIRRTVVRVRGQRAIAILGMHRSGTSSLAGSLQAAGVFLGDEDLIVSRRWNPKGYLESRVLSRLHEGLLHDNGGDWKHPPDSITWSPEARAERDRFIRSRSTREVWGFKDPRSVLLIDGWLEALPDLLMVATVRHPLAVAHSLARRQRRSTPAQWLDLWLAYNRPLLALQREHGFPLIDFDLPAPAYQARLASLVRELGLGAQRPGPAFFEPSLRTASADAAMAVPPEVEQVYQELTAIAAAQARAAARRATVYSPVPR
jgi:hypothetical protein